MAEARRTFRDVRVAHVGSVLADGSPHVVPLWFVWLEEALYLTSRRGSVVERNIRRDPRVAITLHRGQAWTEQAGCMIRAEAEAVGADAEGAKRALSAWFEKYRTELSGFGFGAYTQQVIEPVVIRVRPNSLATWLHAYQPRG
jgi:nitroimidazol reductase NimA-like FMN-containing flavoprotein (pyridoxamine 5'-phosphate oxidase superfamily)